MDQKSNIYSNCSFIFQPDTKSTWSFEEYVYKFDSLECDHIFVQEVLWKNIKNLIGVNGSDQQINEKLASTDTIQIKPNKNMSSLWMDVSLFDKQDRNYFEIYFDVFEKSLYSHKVDSIEFIQYLFKKSILTPINLIVYKELRQTYDVESGQIYGVQYMLYEPGQKDHKHSKILVHIQNQDQNILWSEVYRLVRLSQEVKKKLVIYFYIEDEKDEQIRENVLQNLIQSKKWNEMGKILNIMITKKTEISNLKPT